MMTLDDVYGVVKASVVAATAYAIPMLFVLKRDRDEVLRSARAIGTGVAVYRVARTLLLRSDVDIVRENSIAWKEGVAAMGGTLACCAVDPGMPTALVVSYALVKGSREFLPPITNDTWWLPSATVGLASMVVIPAGYLEPHLAHPSMVKFMEYWIKNIDVPIERWRVPLPGKDLSQGVLQPGQSISGFMVGHAIPLTAYASLKMMLPFYGVWTVASAISSSSKNIVSIVRTNVEGLLRSIVFQTGFSATMWVLTFLYSKYGTGGALRLRDSTLLAGFGGLWTLVERKGRQVELAAFFIAHSLYVLYRRSGIPANTKVGALLLAFAMAPLASKWSSGKKGDHNKLVQLIFH